MPTHEAPESQPPKFEPWDPADAATRLALHTLAEGSDAAAADEGLDKFVTHSNEQLAAEEARVRIVHAASDADSRREEIRLWHAMSPAAKARERVRRVRERRGTGIISREVQATEKPTTDD